MPGPSWLTGWIKLNTKHNVHIIDDCNDEKKHQQTSQSCATDSTSTATDLEAMTFNRSRSHTIRRSLVSQRTSSSSAERRNSVEDQVVGVGTAKTFASSGYDSPRAVADSAGIRPRQRKGTTSMDHQDSIQSKQRMIAPPKNIPQNGMGGLSNILSHAFFLGDQSMTSSCSNCAGMESNLVAVLDDLEYMRDAAIKAQRGVVAKPRIPKLSAPGTTGAWVDTSKQLQEVVSRHQKQVEQLTKESVRVKKRMVV
jgi:hypothetical protein